MGIKMREHCVRLHRGDDLLKSITAVCQKEHIKAGIVLCAVGCVSSARLRDASGVNIRQINEHAEIVSLMGTVSEKRCHVHIALSKQDLSVIGGHLTEGCIINTTCELVLGILDEYEYDAQFDSQTGYDEIIFLEKSHG